MAVIETLAQTGNAPDVKLDFYQAIEHQTGGLHWTHYCAMHPYSGARTMVFIHGAGHDGAIWTMGPAPWVTSFTRMGLDVIAVSLRGHGPSKGLATFQTLHRHVLDVHHIIQAAGVADEEAVITGHSMGGIVAQLLLARYPRIAGAVIVDCVAIHHAFATYLPFARTLFRRHPFTALASMVFPAALFHNTALVRELLVGNEASADLVAALRQHLGGETLVAMPEVLAQTLRGRLPLAGRKVLFLSARQSAFYPPAAIAASAREYGARWEIVDGPHNLMMRDPGATQAAQFIAEHLERLQASAAHPQMAAEPGGVQ
jgi:pimeloyl-ACP methyl ester carboxylesterase